MRRLGEISDSVPPRYIMTLQNGWTRRHRLLAVMEEHEMTLAEVARMMNLTPPRVRQMILKAKRERGSGEKSPIEQWMDPKLELSELAHSTLRIAKRLTKEQAK